MTLLDQIASKLANTRVDIRDVGMREGLQSHNMIVPTAQKIALFKGLVDAGVKEINAVSFVSAKKMPHMADAEALLEGLGDARHGIDISGVVFSDGGLARAQKLRDQGLLDTVFLVFSPISSSMAANGMTPDPNALLDQIEVRAAAAAASGLKVSVFVSESFGSSVEGWVDPELVLKNVARVRDMQGVGELIISDSSGQADPVQVLSLFTRLAGILPVDQRITFHVHDSRGAGLANIVAALSSPFTHFCLDSSFGGLGGDYPFVPDAFGNVATEDLVEMLHGMGIETGIDPDAIVAVSREYAEISGRPLGSRLSGCTRAIDWKRPHRLINPMPQAAA